ncbi:nucleoside diphosphate kinase regulator [Sandaracinobacter sp. RS1-74]|uniref:nucleoside diphosphate kinase regulator n=1 Tax=Sandaracinobacteroides sayramensis TaxID=2913411 RepID=UPI001EDA239C|nr:nucleoside diphosphate kinase regulator [Sandaracinobacteroides sayramensis]MCG2840062.1 nucleoside diphosphate kinase regulator [Sandaracinobacteroides sayramensis]
MKSPKAAARPPIHMLEEEAEKLSNLAISVEERLPQVSELLLGEIDRAKLHKAGRIDKDVVTMNATVDFVDSATGAERRVQLVYPPEADIAAGRISILTPIGAGLIGLKTGQSILWPDREGRTRMLEIRRVEQAA